MKNKLIKKKQNTEITESPVDASTENSQPDKKQKKHFIRLRKFLGKAGTAIEEFSDKHPIINIVVLAVLLNLIMECLGRRNPLDGIAYMVSSPLMFLYNVLIIAMTLSVALLFKRRIFVTFLISIIWLGSAVANCVLLGFRTTPFSAIDLTMISYALSIIDIYLSKTEIIIVSVLVLIVLALIIILGFKAPKLKRKVKYIQAIAVILALIIIVSVATGAAIKMNWLSSRFDNLADAYKNYGFAYCLSNSFIDSGINEPKTYSEEKIDEINDTAYEEATTDSAEEEHPNIIFLQLESFFDPNRLENLYYSRNPVPNFEKVCEEGMSGYLNVATVSAGTANTEFEILTGMSLEYFGAGEYPYKTVLLEETCESIANNLKQLDYHTTAIHNNRATFYGRDEVFPNLGFDTFISKEYMLNLEYTPVSWVKDKCLTEEIISTLDASEEKDFIFTISVQAHGKYPTEFSGEEDYHLYVYSDDDSVEESDLTGFSYLVNQYYEMDQFVGELIEELEDYDEDVVLVLYGDHLPGLDISEDNLSNHSLFQTNYAVWSNCGFDGEDRDLYTYQLGAAILDELGIHEGTMTCYQQTATDKEDYSEGMELLEYDLLYGENYSHDGVNPYTATELSFGIRDITIDHMLKFNSSLYVFGENLTEACSVYINDEMCKTSYYNENMVVVRNAEISPGDEVCVKPAGKNKRPLSTSNILTYDGSVFDEYNTDTASDNKDNKDNKDTK